MMWVIYMCLGALFVYLAHRFVEGKFPPDDDGCDCPECRARSSGQ